MSSIYWRKNISEQSISKEISRTDQNVLTLTPPPIIALVIRDTKN